MRPMLTALNGILLALVTHHKLDLHPHCKLPSSYFWGSQECGGFQVLKARTQCTSSIYSSRSLFFRAPLGSPARTAYASTLHAAARGGSPSPKLLALAVSVTGTAPQAGPAIPSTPLWCPWPLCGLVGSRDIPATDLLSGMPMSSLGFRSSQSCLPGLVTVSGIVLTSVSVPREMFGKRLAIA